MKEEIIKKEQEILKKIFKKLELIEELFADEILNRTKKNV